MAMEESAAAIVRVPGGNDVLSGKRGGKRQNSARERLAGANQIRVYSCFPMRPETAKSPTPCHHLIGDEQDVMFSSDTEKSTKLIGLVHAHSAGSLDQWLNDDGGNFV